MSSLKKLLGSITTNAAGDAIWDVKPPSNSWLLADGSLVLQNTYPRLFSKVGLIGDSNTYNTATEFLLPTGQDVLLAGLNSPQANLYLKGD